MTHRLPIRMAAFPILLVALLTYAHDNSNNIHTAIVDNTIRPVLHSGRNGGPLHVSDSHLAYDNDRYNPHVEPQQKKHHKTQELYPIIADIDTPSGRNEDLKLSTDSETESNRTNATTTSSFSSSTAKTSQSGADDGTISSANSDRVPDFSLEASPYIRVNLFCTIEQSFCSKVAEALRDAASMFNEVVNIKNALLIQATYYSFCEKRCANDTFGWGAPSSQFTLPFEDGADLNYIYPQALAKQLAPYSNTSAWANHDIAIEINHDIYMNSINFDQASSDGWNGTGIPSGGLYYFKNNGTSLSITSDQIDIRYIILHEILHGVGFISSWAAYFVNNASPFHTLIEGIIDPNELQLVTPSPFWHIEEQTGPVFVTGFQPTMIFDKFLYSSIRQSKTSNNRTSDPLSLASAGFDMQNFCVQGSQAFVINFIQEFNRSNQSRHANHLWTSLSNGDTLSFHFPAPAVDNSSYNTNPYLNETYKTMKLLTGDQVLTSHAELSDRNFRLGIAISHLDETYSNTPDFIMTGSYIRGQTLEDIIEDVYGGVPPINYSIAAAATVVRNSTMIQRTYRSPIGPGVLRILDSMGYSTVLSNTNYTTTGNVKSGKMPSVCDDKNNNHAMSKSPKPVIISIASLPDFSSGLTMKACLLLISAFVYPWSYRPYCR
ncbi:hypothetical protein BX666DRAFT_453233 [Dichotomocladium elegans]|nr:hypothetical protein BX666DRAFT_453233 [Dichotomocladium elegans]